MNLWAHQQADLNRYLKTPSLYNASACGTGKTRTIIEVIKGLQLPTLILAPKSVCYSAWVMDFKKFAPEVKCSLAAATNRRAAFEEDTMVKITNVDAITWLIKPENADLVEQFKGGFLVIDEATALKTPTSKRTKAAMKLRPIFAHCTAMSGTPNPLSILDIWSQMYIVDQGESLGSSFYRFRSNVCSPVSKGAFTTWTPKEGITDAVGEIIASKTIRNSREDCLDLPENLLVTRSIQLSNAHMKLYQDLKRKAILELKSGTVTAPNAAVLLQKLMQCLSGSIYDEQGVAHSVDSDRYELITDLIEERTHTVCFFQYRHQRDELIKLANKRGLAYGLIDGSVTNMFDRANTINDFQAGKLRVLFGHCASIAHGVTLTTGVATIFTSGLFNTEHYVQGCARIHRAGVDHKTETILISAENTIEPEVWRKLLVKETNMNDLLELLNG